MSGVGEPTETNLHSIQAFMEVDRYHNPDLPYAAWANGGLQAFCSGRFATRRKAWQGLAIQLMESILKLSQQRDDAIHRINELAAEKANKPSGDEVLASEVRQRHELQDELDKIEEWRKAVRNLYEGNEALKKESRQAKAELDSVRAERDALRRIVAHVRDITNSTA